MYPQGLKPHTHAERAALIEQLVPLWQKKFGDNLLGIAAAASYARGEDRAYSDLELELFVKELPVGEDAYYQRVVDGMLIEVIYRTPQEYLRQRSEIAPHWHLSASDRLLPVYNAPFIEAISQQARAAQHSEAEFLRAAAGERYELQETIAKVLNGIQQNNLEGMSLLVMDATMRVLQILALVNRQPFVTFARYIAQARQFAIKPERFDDLLDILVQGTYRDLPHLQEVVEAVFAGMEKIFAERGFPLYDDPLDPNLPNPSLAAPEPAKQEGLAGEMRLVPVNEENFHECGKLPTGLDHKHVAPNTYSIAQAQFWPGARSCCIYHNDEMVGYVLYGPDYDEERYQPVFWVGRLMIAETQRNKGYGRAVMHKIIAEARRLGYPEVGLSTGPDNAKAIGLYESLGFHATEIDDGEMVYILPLI